MGIALIALTSLSQPVKALTQFLGGPARHKSLPALQAADASRPATSASATAAPEATQQPASQHAAGPFPAWTAAPTAAAGTAVALATSTDALKPHGGPRPSRGRLAGGIKRPSAVPATSVMPANAAPAHAPRPAATPWMNVPASRPRAAAAANADRFHPAGGSAAADAASEARSATPRPLLRVLRRVQVGEPARLVISGRMADVCAELDRLVASEGRLAL